MRGFFDTTRQLTGAWLAASGRRLERDVRCRRLVMTLLVRDEEDVVERHVRFHHAMGVDGFVVTSHKSSDRTDEILERLKREGLVLEILRESSDAFDQVKWVTRMIRLARDRHGADWVINADADEYYYSEQLDLKETIRQYAPANCLWFRNMMFFPDGSEDFFGCPYFVTRPLKRFEAEALGVSEENGYGKFIWGNSFQKVAHATAGFVGIAMGNHDVSMRNKVPVHCADIKAFHYHIRNYSGYVEKVRRYADCAQTMPKGKGEHIKRMVRLLREGRLREDYESRFSREKLDFLLREGVVTIDPSVRNFLRKLKAAGKAWG